MPSKYGNDRRRTSEKQNDKQKQEHQSDSECRKEWIDRPFYESSPNVVRKPFPATLLKLRPTPAIHLTVFSGFGQQGQSKQQVVGRPIFDLYDPACHDSVHQAFRDFIRTGRVENAELTLRTAGGESVPVILNVAAVRDPDGKISHSSSTWVDVTDLRQKSAALKQANAELEQFAYVASHDLKAPLRAIDNLATWLKEDLAGKLPEASESHLAQLRQRVSRMEKLLDDLLTYSRAGRLRGKQSVIDLAELVGACLPLLNLPEVFAVESELKVTQITGHRTPLETVVRNLVGNAVKHHDRPTGRIKVLVETVGTERGFVEFTIADDGPGIASELREKAFAMFQTLRPRDEVEGSGMGLALAKKIVEAEGGAIRIEENSPRGTLVCFTWPANPQG